MNLENIIQRTLSGAIYVAIMWFGTSYSKLSFNLLFGIILLVCLYEMYKLRKGKKKILAYTYILVPFLLIQFIGMTESDYPGTPFDPSIILLIFILTWTFDTFAYLVGVQYGKHKIIPSISPKKSWEGFIGGFLLTIIVAYLSQKIFIHIGLEDILFVEVEASLIV